VLTPDGSPVLEVMDFSSPMSLDPLPDGWYHRVFRTSDPMELSFATKSGQPALRLATHGTASMLVRHVEVPIQGYPILAWRWLIERGIRSGADERTSAGDDHPARLTLAFESPDGDRHRTEIIWGNRLETGEYVHLQFGPSFLFDPFPHYVANGGEANEARWHAEQLDLTVLHRELWGDPVGARLVDIGLFCDSDQTGDRTVTYVADVRLQQASEP
jgi:hypothetical protein